MSFNSVSNVSSLALDSALIAAILSSLAFLLRGFSLVSKFNNSIPLASSLAKSSLASLFLLVFSTSAFSSAFSMFNAASLLALISFNSASSFSYLAFNSGKILSNKSLVSFNAPPLRLDKAPPKVPVLVATLLPLPSKSG